MPENTTAELSFQDLLKEDRDGTFRRAVLDELGEVGAEIMRRENEGLPADDYKSLSGLKTAVEESKEVVNKAWEMYRNGS